MVNIKKEVGSFSPAVVGGPLLTIYLSPIPWPAV